MMNQKIYGFHLNKKIYVYIFGDSIFESYRLIRKESKNTKNLYFNHTIFFGGGGI